MGSYEDDVRTLEVELRGVEQAFRDLTPEQWRTPTKLQPLDDAQPHWTVFELARPSPRRSRGARSMAPDTIGPGYYALMRLDEFVPSRVVEAVVHGWTSPTPSVATPSRPGGVAMTAAILDDLLARKTVAGRPQDLADDLAWVRAASGRAPHPDPRLPLIG
jgi:hypothetical protein